MRAFIVLCLVVASCADKLGYNYKPVGHSDIGLSFVPGGSAGHTSSGFNGGVGHVVNGGSSVGGSSFGGPVKGFGVSSVSFNGGNNGGHTHGGPGFGVGSGVEHVVNGGSSVGGSGYGGPVSGFGVNSVSFNDGNNGGHINAGPSFGIGSGVAGSEANNFNGGVSYTPQAVLEKEFYTFTANDDDFSVPHVENQITSSGKKNLRVIFIKGPEHNGLENAAVALAKHIAEQKTAIYVLQKQTDLSSLSNKLHTINSNINHKPEVHFVKYRTQEDAVNAQNAIRGQYEALGGVSNNYNGGEAPVLNFASQASVANHVGHDSAGSVGSSVSHGSFDQSVSIGSEGSVGSSATFESTGSVGSSGHSSSSSSYATPSAPSPNYLPA